MAPTESRQPGEYDLFVSYSHADREWVAGRLLPLLERAGLRVAVDYRDFAAGLPSIVNMENAVQQSRHILVVLTPRWVGSEWSDFEGILAGTGDPVGRKRKLIPLMRETCEPPPRIRMLTYVDFRPEADQALAESNLLRAVAGGLDSLAPAAPLAPPPPNVDWKAELPDLLVRSGRAQASSRTALCIQCGIDVNDLSFLEAAPRDFALQLVGFLDQAGDREALRRICRALEPLLKGGYGDKLRAVRDALAAGG